ncbi:MAG: response regulator transcription factor [Gemmatimonadetes bacterium]|nr:response regulator transcription factor [Gemmatimonadota bacterium]
MGEQFQLVDEVAGDGRAAPRKVLLVEDEDALRRVMKDLLEREGFIVFEAADGVKALDEIDRAAPDIVVLDLNLPKLDGYGVLSHLRARPATQDLPVIVLTARDSVTDTVAALEGGAADYMSKPFKFGELLARVRLRLRSPGEAPPDDELAVGDVRLDLRRRRAFAGEREVELSAREFALAEVLLRNRGLVLSREQLLSQVWGYDFDPGSNVVDVYVGYLRRKFGSASIVTVRGMGYRFSA